MKLNSKILAYPKNIPACDGKMYQKFIRCLWNNIVAFSSFNGYSSVEKYRNYLDLDSVNQNSEIFQPIIICSI